MAASEFCMSMNFDFHHWVGSFWMWAMLRPIQSMMVALILGGCQTLASADEDGIKVIQFPIEHLEFKEHFTQGETKIYRIKSRLPIELEGRLVACYSVLEKLEIEGGGRLFTEDLAASEVGGRLVLGDSPISLMMVNRGRCAVISLMESEKGGPHVLVSPCVVSGDLAICGDGGMSIRLPRFVKLVVGYFEEKDLNAD